MLPVGRGLLPVVALLACLLLIPVRADADVIDLGTISSSVAIGGEFTADNDVALIFLSLAGTAVLTVDMTSQVATDPGFDPILTLFAAGTDFLGLYDYVSDATLDSFVPSTGGLTLAAGDYVLALTQYANYYFPGLGFEQDAAPNGMFTYDFFGDTDFDGVPDVPCTSFVSIDGGCRSSRFAGSLTIEYDNAQPVPEPGSVTLLAIGCAALIARRSRRGRQRPPAAPES